MKVLQMSQVDNLIPEHIKLSVGEAEVDSEGEINMDRVPFAKNTIRMDLKQIDKSLKALNSQNKENMKTNDADENENRTCTPTNEVEQQTQPLTPTANLKVLFNAMSPELRNRDEQRREDSDDDSSAVFTQTDYQFETIIEYGSSQDIESDLSKYGNSRKEKSLGLLCQKFLQKYPEYPTQGEKYEICLDEVAKELQVERRRIYDIVNVLESVEIVSRVAKNKYAWHGKSNLYTTLAKLKALGDSEGFGEQIQKLKDFEFNRELEEQLGRNDTSVKLSEPDFSMFGDSSLFNQAALRKDKSLGIMSQKFLMLFLVSKPKTVNLDLSAKLLIGDANIDKTENAKFKTKIRRLYDIANILTSLDLIRKVHVTEIRGRKPAFKYVGPDIDSAKELHLTCCSDGCHRPSSRHSMLDCIQNQHVARLVGSYQSSKPGTLVTKTNDDGTVGDASVKVGRHTSFEQLCAVAAVETTRMNASAPSSPSKEGSEKDGSPQTQKGLPTRGFVRKKTVPKPKQAVPKSKRNSNETIIIKTAKSNGSVRQPTVIPLTKEQIDAVLRSLKVPVPVSKDNTQTEATILASEAGTAQVVSPQTKVEETSDLPVKPCVMKELNETTPVVMNTPENCGKKRINANIETIPAEKRVRLDFPSPPHSEDDKSPIPSTANVINRLKRKVALDVKPSPQRALHLAPEFTNPSMTPSGDASSVEDGAVVSSPKKIEIIVSSASKLPNTGSRDIIQHVLSPVRKTTGNSVSAAVNHLVNHTVARTIGQSQPQTVTVQLNGQPTILQLPVLPSSAAVSQSSNGSLQPVTVSIPLHHNVQLVQDRSGQIQQIVHVPCTMSPPLTPGSSSQSSQSVYTYSYPSTQSSNITLTNVHIIQPMSVKSQTSNVATIIRPVATKPVTSPNHSSQIVPPVQYVCTPSLSPSKSNKSTGSFIPVASFNNAKQYKQVTVVPVTSVNNETSTPVS